MRALWVLYRGPAVSIGIQVGGMGLGLVASVLLARLLGAEGFGVYSFAYSLVVFLGIPLHVGLATLLLKEVASLTVAGDSSRLRGLIRASYALTLLLSLAAAAVLAGLFGVNSPSRFKDYSGVVVWGIALVPAMALNAIRGGILRGLGHPIAGQLPDSLIRPSVFVASLCILIFLIERFTLNAEAAMLMQVLAALAALVFGFVAVHRLLPCHIRKAVPRYEWKLWAGALLPLSTLAGIQAVGGVISVLSLAYYYPAQEVGYYRVAELGASLVSLPTSTMALYVAARIAKLHAELAPDALQQEIKTAGRFVFVLVAPAALILILFGHRFLGQMFGEAFTAAAAPLAILSIAQIASASVGLVAVVMNMTGNYGETVRAFACALTGQLLLTAVLVPSFGATGAAVAAGLGTIIWSQLLFWRIRKMYLISTSPFIAFR